MKNTHQEPQTQHTLSVYFCGQEDCGPGHSFGPAMRPHYLLHVIFHGKGIYQCGGHTYHLKAGDAFLIRPMDSIYYRADNTDPWSYAWAGFDGSACKEILEQTIFSDTRIFTPETPAQQNNLLTRMTNLLATFSENNGNDLAIAGNLLLMLSSVQKKPSESRTDIATLYFQKASEYIKNNYAYPIQISDVARYVGIDRSYLYRIFMEKEKLSPKQYLLRHRLRMAVEMLCTTSYSITEIALSCGFHDASSFSGCFRKEFHVSPRDFRQNARMDTNGLVSSIFLQP